MYWGVRTWLVDKKLLLAGITEGLECDGTVLFIATLSGMYRERERNQRMASR